MRMVMRMMMRLAILEEPRASEIDPEAHPGEGDSLLVVDGNWRDEALDGLVKHQCGDAH